MNLQKIEISSLKSDPQNVRVHSERNIQTIAASLEEFGQRKPIISTIGGTILAGNGTLEAAKRLGWSSIYVIHVPADWTSEQARAFAIADNRTAELSAWISPVLADQLERLGSTGFTPASLGFNLADEPQMSQSSTREIDPDGFSYDHTCPGCGFAFNA